ncbi:MAG: transaldolase [Anaerolineae bacterium]|nr:transaldolase [Anaerolineae bacterium]
MGIFLDSANPDDVRRAQELGFVKAVTTNPTLIARSGRSGLDVLSELVELFDGHVFYQVTADTVEKRFDQAWEAHRIRPDRVIIKVPATTQNLAMTARLVAAGIECAVTAVASPAQAYLAAQVEASFVAPYISRLTQHVGGSLDVVRDIARLLENTQTEILAASIKSVDEAVAVMLAGAQHVTLPLELIMAMGEHELSQQAIEEFHAQHHGE